MIATEVVGNFGEYLVCKWLCHTGFDVSIVDHTGMDIVAYYPPTEQRLGITVKSRLRTDGATTEGVYVFREAKEDRRKLLEACKAFGCEPWIAVYVEHGDGADLFLTSLDNYDGKYRSTEKRAIDVWGMTQKHIVAYEKDSEVRYIHMDFRRHHWWQPRAMAAATTQ
ncbi:MAG: hypothetical protein ABSD98_01225 [Candidatus Korobacteraceae bacterium]|jgi:hypothetical protein